MDRKTLGRYLILGELGHGAMGSVFRAKDPLIEREVAVKTLLASLPAEVLGEARERFLREARSAGRLNHPNIVTIFDVGQDGETAFIAMELLEGRSLQQMMRAAERLPFDQAADLAAQIAEALDYAHRFSIVHRDVKPANVMVDAAGRAKLTDFGVAHVASSTVTQTGAAVGSPRYMSPEQVLGQPVDARTDVFSLGSVLYEMLTRRAPFDREGDSNVFPLMHRIAGEAHAPARALDAAVPEALSKIADKALAKKPEERYQRAAEMASDLRNWRNLARGATGERSTVFVPPAQKAAPAASPPPAAVHDLLGDLDAFSKQLDVEHQELARKAEEEKRAREEAQRRAFEATVRLNPAARAPAPAPAAAARSGALDLLRSRPPGPATVDPVVARKNAVAALDQAMRVWDKYFAEFMHEVTARHPHAGKPYPMKLLGSLPRVALANGRSDSRPKRVDGADCLDTIVMRFRVNPDPPEKQLLHRDDIAPFENYLKSLGATWETVATAKNDFGQAIRAVLTIKAGPECEIRVRADYDALDAAVELLNVRQPGKRGCRIPAAQLGAAADELGRYVLGADDDFARRLSA